MENIIPVTAEGILDEFWSSPQGQTIAEALWRLHSTDALSIMEAADLLGLKHTSNTASFIESHFKRYRKPDSQMLGKRPQSRKVSDATNRAWYVLRSDVLAYREE